MTTPELVLVIERAATSQGWVLGVILALSAVAKLLARSSRVALRAFALLTLLAVITLVAASALTPVIGESAAGLLRDLAIFIEGAVIISLSGSVLFSGLLPHCGLHLPRIVQDVAVACGGVTWLFALLWLRNVNLSGIIAGSAVVTAIIGLSMQDTLGNLVAGLAVQLDDSLDVGDWIKIDDIQGRVVEMGWRRIAVETRNWETVMVPNSVMARGKFTVQGRRSEKPVQWRRWVWFNVDHRWTPSEVIETVEAALRQAELPRVAPDPPPNCVAMEFAESFTRYAVRYWLTDLAADDPTDSDVRTHVVAALKRAGISLALPAHAVFLTEEENAERRLRKAREDQEQRVRALRKVALFNRLPDEELETLASQLVYAPFAQGDVMTRQGSEAHWLYIVSEGTAERYVETEGTPSTLVNAISAGEVFGEWSLVNDMVRETTVVARSSVLAYRLPKSAFLAALTRNQNLAHEIATVMGEKRTALDAALQHLDEEARQRRGSENETTVMQSLRRLFGV